MAKTAARNRATKKSRRERETDANPGKRKRPPAIQAELLTEPPPPPESLAGEFSRELWTRLAPDLVALQLLSRLDLEALTVLCDSWQTYCDTADTCNNPRKRFIKSKRTGHISEHPAIRLRQQAINTMAQLWRQFGLTPLTRENLDVDITEKAGNTLAAYAEKRGD